MSDTRTAKRLPVFHQRGVRMNAGDVFRLAGNSRSRFRFVAYVIPPRGPGYVECVEVRGNGKVVNGGTRCIDAGRVGGLV